jgi:hypothetical protein
MEFIPILRPFYIPIKFYHYRDPEINVHFRFQQADIKYHNKLASHSNDILTTATGWTSAQSKTPEETG